MHARIQYITISVLLVLLGVAGLYATKAPTSFPLNSSFEVEEGESLRSISSRLKEEHFISSETLFKAWVSLLGKDTKIGLGSYTFDEARSMSGVVAKLTSPPDEPLLSVTIPEGYSTEEIAQAFHRAMPSLSEARFVQLVRDEKLDGYLFPSTYYPLPSHDESAIIQKMKAEFDKQYAAKFGKTAYPKYVSTQHAIITLASILEGEAKTQEDMKIVSGILQKRLSIGMRLQVDVSRVTYEKTGLPDAPINSPGLIALDAAFHPIQTSYMYYITGKDGKMYYAKTFEEHKRNIAKYLR